MELGIIEIYNSNIHGDKILDGSLLVFETFTTREFLDNDYDETCEFLEDSYNSLVESGLLTHNIITNYINIISGTNNINNFHTIKLIKRYFTNSGVQLAIDKSYLIRCIQRKWRKILQERKRIIYTRSNPREIYYKRITGKWSSRCRKFV